MQENVLIFRSAKHYIVENLINELKKQGDKSISLVVQDESKSHYGNETSLNLIIYPEGFFHYQTLIQNDDVREKLSKIEYDKIYVPYSTAKPKVEEVEKIIVHVLGQKEIYLYDKFGNVKKHHINMLKYALSPKCEQLKHHIVAAMFHLLGIWYMRGIK